MADGTTIQDLRAAAKLRGGLCLSGAYLGAGERHLWCCRRGHHFWLRPAEVEGGRWCARCLPRESPPQRELYERVRAEHPDAVNNAVGVLAPSRLELDIWVPGSRRAVEYDGVRAHQGPAARRRDERKTALCRRLGIRLMRVPHLAYVRDRAGWQRRVLDFFRSPARPAP